MTQIEQHAGEKARFRGADEKSQQVEARGRGDHRRRCAERAPQQQDAEESASCADATQQQIAGYLEQAIAEIEQPAGESIRGLADVQIGAELQLGDADVRAVDSL